MEITKNSIKTDNKLNKEIYNNINSNNIIIPIKILLTPTQIKEKENNKDSNENLIYNKEISYCDLKDNNYISPNLSCQIYQENDDINKKLDILLGKKRIIKNSYNYLNQKNKNIKNIKKKINDYQYNSKYSKKIINTISPHKLLNEKKEKKINIFEKVKKYKAKNNEKEESSPKRINKCWINWINEVISLINDNNTNDKNCKKEKFLLVSLSENKNDVPSKDISNINDDKIRQNIIDKISHNERFINISKISNLNYRYSVDKFNNINEDLTYNYDNDLTKNISNIKSNHDLFE